MKTTPLIALSLFLLSAVLRADVKVTTSAAKPAAAIAASHEVAGAAGNITAFKRGTGAFRAVGQAFAADHPFELTGFTWRLWESDPQVEGKRFSIKVYRLAAVNKAPEPGSTPVFSEEGTLPQTLHPREYITFQFSGSAGLEKGAYLILFNFEEPTSPDASARLIGFERSEENAGYGRIWTFNGETFAADNKAFTFYAHGR